LTRRNHRRVFCCNKRTTPNPDKPSETGKPDQKDKRQRAKPGETRRNRNRRSTLPKLEVAGSSPVSRSPDFQGFVAFCCKPFIFALQQGYNRPDFCMDIYDKLHLIGWGVAIAIAAVLVVSILKNRKR